MASRRPMGELIVEVGLDASSFNQNLKGISNDLKTASSSMKAHVAIMEAAGDEYGVLEAKVDGLNRMMDINDRKIDELKRRHQAAIETYGAESEQVQKLSAQINNSVRQQAAWQRQLQRTGEQVEKMAREMAEAENKMVQFGQGMDRTSEKLNALGDRINTRVTPAIAGIGIAAGKVATDMDTAATNMQNALGLTEEQAKQTAGKMQNVWKKGFGEDVGEVSQALIQVKQNMRGIDDGSVENLTKNSLALASTWGADVNEVTRASNNIMQNFGTSADKAMDLLAKGGQRGLNFSNELFDNMSEYAPLWSKMGFSAEEMFSTLASGMDEGVYNLDYVNDIMKEFQIRVKDGSKTSSDAMALLSKSTQNVWKDFQNGKGTVKDVSDAVLKELASMDDQVVAGQIGVGLYGTKFEDLESTAVYALGNVKNEFDDVDGTADKVAKNLEESFSYKLKTTIRDTASALQPLGETLIEVANVALPAVKEGAAFVNDTFDGMSEGSRKLVVGLGASVVAVGLLSKVLSPVFKLGGLVTQRIGKNRVQLDAETLALIRNTQAQNANANARGGNGKGSRTSPSGGTQNTNGTRSNQNNRQRPGASRTGQLNDYHGNNTRTENNPSDRVSKVGKIGKVAKLGGALGLAVGGYSIYEATKTKGDNKGAAVGGAVGSTGGGAAGAAIGAALGSVVPGLGTAIGGIAGGIIGSVAGDAIGKKIGNQYDKEKAEKKAQEKIQIGAKLNLDVKGVSKGTQEAMNAFEKLRTQSQQKLDTIYASNRTITNRIETSMKTSYDKMTVSTVASIQAKQVKERALAVKALNNNKKLSAQERQEALASLDKKHASERNKINRANERIKTILTNAKNSKRALTAKEKAEIEKLTNQMNNAKVRSTTKSEKESTAILRAQRTQRNSVRTKELNQVISNATKQYKAVVSKAKKEEQDTVAAAKRKYERKVAQAKIQYKTLGTISKNEYDNLVGKAKKEREETIKQAESKRKGKTSKAEQQKNRVIKHAQKERDDVVQAAQEERKKSIKESEKQTSGIASVWSKLTGQLDKAIEWVKNLFGNDSGNPSVPKIDTKFKAQAYAKGTYNGRHPGGTALVGEEGRELAHIPGVGMSMVGVGGPQILDLPKGTAVLPHGKTENMMKSYGFPTNAYANGTGDDGFFGKVWGSVKNGAAYLKGKAVDAMDWVSEAPEKVFDKMAEAFGLKYKSNAINTALIGKAPLEYVKEMGKDFIQQLMDSFDMGGSGGDFGNWTPFTGDFNKISNKMGVYDYLYDLGKQIVSKFKAKYSGLYISSGKRSTSANTGGVVSDHTTGLGLDLARGGIRDNSYFQMARSLQNHPYLKMVIGSNMWSKNGSEFSKYPYAASSPHDNHLHLSAKSPKEAKSASATGNVSGGAKAWTAQIKKAHKEIYGKAISQQGLSAVLEQIQTESGGNASIKQGITDVNSRNGSGGAKGLLQFIQTTFDNYKVKGHGNIWSGYDQLLAMFNVKEWYSAITRAGVGKGWSPRGGRVKGYANGGLVTQHQFAQIAEGNKPEIIIPLDRAKRGRALQLLSQAQAYIGDDGNKQTSLSSTNPTVQLLAKQIELLNQQVALLTQIAVKDVSVLLDGKEITSTVNRINSTQERMSNRAKGVSM